MLVIKTNTLVFSCKLINYMENNHAFKRDVKICLAEWWSKNYFAGALTSKSKENAFVETSWSCRNDKRKIQPSLGTDKVLYFIRNWACFRNVLWIAGCRTLWQSIHNKVLGYCRSRFSCIQKWFVQLTISRLPMWQYNLLVILTKF